MTESSQGVSLANVMFNRVISVRTIPDVAPAVLLRHHEVDGRVAVRVQGRGKPPEVAVAAEVAVAPYERPRFSIVRNQLVGRRVASRSCRGTRSASFSRSKDGREARATRGAQGSGFHGVAPMPSQRCAISDWRPVESIAQVCGRGTPISSTCRTTGAAANAASASLTVPSTGCRRSRPYFCVPPKLSNARRAQLSLTRTKPSFQNERSAQVGHHFPSKSLPQRLAAATELRGIHKPKVG